MKNFNCIIKGIIITLGKSDSVSPVTCSKMFYKKHAARNVYTPSTQSNNSVFVCVCAWAGTRVLACVCTCVNYLSLSKCIISDSFSHSFVIFYDEYFQTHSL